MIGRSKPLSLSQQSLFSFGLLIKLRWIALAGQGLTIGIVYAILGFALPLTLCLSIIGFSALINILIWIYQGNRQRIPLSEIVYFLLYDLGQLTALIFITGGLNNPFALLILVPSIVAAGFLYQQKSLFIAVATLFAIGFLSLSPYPLPWYNTGLVLPNILQVANALALITTTVFVALYLTQIAKYAAHMSKALEATQMALAREQQLASLGALAAAAAHELGTPLNTITLIAKEMLTDTTLPPGAPPDLRLILDQIYRCRDILRDLARNFAGDKGAPFSKLPLSAAIDVVCQQLPHSLEIQVIKPDQPLEPLLSLSPELMHSLNNIISNAVQFAKTKVEIILDWTPTHAEILVHDDGAGFTKEILEKIGNPYISSRIYNSDGCHLGLGLFIAQTLLEQMAGQLYCYNDTGAVCKIVLPRETS